MSTQVFGPYDKVMDVLRRELRATFESLGLQVGQGRVRDEGARAAAASA